jgi:hypothetical protein
MQSSNPITPASAGGGIFAHRMADQRRGLTPQLSYSFASAYSVIMISGSCTDGFLQRRIRRRLGPRFSGSHSARRS